MKNPLFSLIATAVVSTALLIPAGFAQTAPIQTPPKVMPRNNGKEKHPEMQAAIRHLEEAKARLQAGAHDFGGHRAKALEHVNEALRECREALESDKK